MKLISLLLCLDLFSYCATSQDIYSLKNTKSVIDSAAYKKWVSIDGGTITNDGRFVSYIINNLPTGSCTMVMRGSESNWEIRIKGVREVRFAADSRNAFVRSNDTLFCMKLGSSEYKAIPAVEAFDIPITGCAQWFVYRNVNSKGIVLDDIYTGKKNVYPSVVNFFFSGNGNFLIMEVSEKIEGEEIRSIELVDLKSLKQRHIWKGKGLIKMVLNDNVTQLAFLTSENDRKALWIYNEETKDLRLLVNDMSSEIRAGLRLCDLTSISEDGEHIFVTMGKVAKAQKKKNSQSTVNIWSYLDLKLQPGQSENNFGGSYYSAVVGTRSRKVTYLTGDNEYIASSSKNNDVFLIEHMGGGEMAEVNWNDSSKRSYYVVDLNSNSRRLLKIDGMHLLWLSPNGKYIIYYDNASSGYLCYEVASGIWRNITKGLSTSFISIYFEDREPRPRGVAGWLNDDVLVYDRFDIWKIDPQGKRKALNLTNGYGRRHNIFFYLALSEYTGETIPGDSGLLLNAFNMDNKQNGFFQAKLDKPNDPELLTMGDYIYQLIDNPYIPSNCGSYPVKAKNARKFVVKRMSATESPNYFLTSNFSKFKQISEVFPERDFNWYSTELHVWQEETGKVLHGILYKPENFDSTKMYPVIIHYYEKKSFELNEYFQPEDVSSGCNINIPTFVSNGYLVFTPDIDFIAGDPMQGTYNSVVSAAKHLLEFKFVDAKRLGIGGCSFGGVQTNYLITHTDIFAAAYSASSMVDFISGYGGLFNGRIASQSYFERGGQGRMGGTIWQNPGSYVKSSSIFNADKVKTPLLLMHTTEDPVCPFSQAVEFYTALRRLGKRVWMLEYTDGHHSINGNSAKDFGIRMMQFFNHYLKGTPAPVWMTRGVSQSMKGIDDGFDLDSIIKTPGKGLIEY